MTNNQANTSFEQSALPFGTALPAESSGFSNQVFTSYDRSSSTGLDYAVNRTYSPGQGRFTQPDPIEMGSVSLVNPQSFNLYAYVENNPVDFVDPNSLCIIGINIVGLSRVSGKTLDAIRKEIQRIFSAAGQTVTFNSAERADARFKINLTNAPSTAGRDTLGSTGVDHGVVRSSGAAFVDRIGDFRAERDAGLRALGKHPTNLGRAIGRVVSHEAGHFLLQLLGHSQSGIMRELFRGDRSLYFSNSSKDFLFSDDQARQLSELCMPAPKTSPHEDLPDVPQGGGEVVQSEHGGGELQIWTGVGVSPIDWLTWEYSNRPPTITY